MAFLMRLSVLLSFLAISTPSFAETDYVKVELQVVADKEWRQSIQTALAAKLNAIPDVLAVTEECGDCVFRVHVDVNRLLSQSNAVFGYDLVSLVMGTYDSAMMKYLFAEAEPKTEKEQAINRFVDFMIQGNVWLASVDHTYGPVADIGDAYDLIVSALKGKAIPKYRQFQTELMKLIKASSETDTAAPRSTRGNKNSL